MQFFNKYTFTLTLTLGATSGAAKTYLGKRKYDDLINTISKLGPDAHMMMMMISKIRKSGKGIVYE